MLLRGQKDRVFAFSVQAVYENRILPFDGLFCPVVHFYLRDGSANLKTDVLRFATVVDFHLKLLLDPFGLLCPTRGVGLAVVHGEGS